LGDVPRSGDCGEASEPIRDHAEQLALQIWELFQNREEGQNRDAGPAAAKKRRTELEPDISFEEDVFMQKIENAMANACRGFIMPGGTSSSASDMQSLRAEVKEDIARVQTQLTEVFNSAIHQMQVEADRRTAGVFERLVQQVQEASRQTDKGETTTCRAHAATSDEAVKTLRKEMRENMATLQAQLTEVLNAAIAKVQMESDRRTDAMLQRLEEKIYEASEKAGKGVPPRGEAHKIPGAGVNQNQPARDAQRTWANVTRTGTQSAGGWTNVATRKNKPKKHPLDQRRILFVRHGEPHHCDTRDIMFEANKALAHARAGVAVRFIKAKYTEKGNLSCVLSEHTCAEELLEYAPTVMAAVQKLDSAVIDVEKTEKWRKLRVHGVALDRYLTESGLDLAREEIEVMTGSQLPYAPRWIKGDTLAERFDSGAIKRSTLVLTVKTKHAADTIMAKGLSFGGRRHEAERFWTKGEGSMCMQCCGQDHFGRCPELAKCYICAGDHEGTKHICEAEGCGKKEETCEHHTAKCANCGGAHMATSRKCPERFESRQRRTNNLKTMRSSPPLINTELSEDQPSEEIEEETHISQLVPREMDRDTQFRCLRTSVWMTRFLKRRD